eukprot:gnl/TRDRNA2_/TRDRNA2_87010_c0_seq1.p1 gnl/TRDRNA2_/TRDRNA2_87010_c0~~gnl/TRDRNA2_/TRDRNA2_87010_c0_seq1.p1  ORF type:complete len:279 (+),score=4.12 gnl/TRDRNA2_/TRDRNA2_87010_c0_seq1:44-880(+)
MPWLHSACPLGQVKLGMEDRTDRPRPEASIQPLPNVFGDTAVACWRRLWVGSPGGPPWRQLPDHGRLELSLTPVTARPCVGDMDEDHFANNDNSLCADISKSCSNTFTVTAAESNLDVSTSRGYCCVPGSLADPHSRTEQAALKQSGIMLPEELVMMITDHLPVSLRRRICRKMKPEDSLVFNILDNICPLCSSPDLSAACHAPHGRCTHVDFCQEAWWLNWTLSQLPRARPAAHAGDSDIRPEALAGDSNINSDDCTTIEGAVLHALRSCYAASLAN